MNRHTNNTIGNITYDSTPDLDAWGWDDYWSCYEWMDYHKALVYYYIDVETANQIWLTEWSKQDSFANPYNWCKYDSVIRNYFQSVGIDLDSYFSAVIMPTIETGAEVIDNLSEGVQNTSKALKYLPHIAIGAATLYAYTNRKKLKKLLKQ